MARSRSTRSSLSSISHDVSASAGIELGEVIPGSTPGQFLAVGAGGVLEEASPPGGSLAIGTAITGSTDGKNLIVGAGGVLEEDDVPVFAITIGDPVGSGTPNSVLFVDGSSDLGEDANLTWDGSVLHVDGQVHMGRDPDLEPPGGYELPYIEHYIGHTILDTENYYFGGMVYLVVNPAGAASGLYVFGRWDQVETGGSQPMQGIVGNNVVAYHGSTGPIETCGGVFVDTWANGDVTAEIFGLKCQVASENATNFAYGIRIAQGTHGNATNVYGLRIETQTGGSNLNEAIHVDSGLTNLDTLRVRGTSTPATAGADGTAGDIAFDSDYMYRCVATNTWKRVALATW